MRNKSVVWIPVLLVGAMVYWTLALGFGGLSLVSLTSELPSPEGDARDSYQSITVNLSDSWEAELPDPRLPGPGVTVDLVPDLDGTRTPEEGEGAQTAPAEGGGQGLTGGAVRNGPGQTAF
jgi:hypothetical protein